MKNLEQLLAEEEKINPNGRYTQMLRDQVAAQKTGKSAQEIYITGSIAPKDPPAK
jgi:hypothetical protein